MSHPQIEEVSDSDPSEGDISDIDDDFDERDIMRARSSGPQAAPSYLSSALSSRQAAHPDAIAQNNAKVPQANPSLMAGRSIPSTGGAPPLRHLEDDSKYKNFQCIYPVYFDQSRSRGRGRMVGKELAVENPHAREIANACGRLGLETVFEPHKSHPKDWANPGRVKIKLKGGNNKNIKNKHHLYTLISKHLQANPTTTATALGANMHNIPRPDPSKPYPTPAVPEGWKMNEILPYWSPALSGGGVSDNFFKDVMEGMGGAGGAGGMPAGMPDLSAMQAMMGNMGGLMGGGGAPSPSAGALPAPKKEKKKKK